MKHDDLGARLKFYEDALDRVLAPDAFIVARIDGRGFSRLTKEELTHLEKPFDAGLRDALVATTRHLAEGSGFDVAYAYSQSDEISLLFRRRASVFGRRTTKWLSVLAAEASATLSLALGRRAVFDARLLELPNESLVVDYFRWRYEDAARNALSAHCYWALRGDGKSVAEATAEIDALAVSARHELLHARGTPFQDLPTWHRRGVGIWPESVEREGRDPRTGEVRTAVRRAWRVELELPARDAYDGLIRERVAAT